MKTLKLFTICFLSFFFVFSFSELATAQVENADYYNVNAGNGKGIRFWNGNNNYKIGMGTGTNYKYGPVQDYSIKMTMNNDSDRGWTWGVLNQVPIAALNTQGNMQLAGNLTASRFYFKDYGGGFHMSDNGWIRTSGNKNFYHNAGIMRTDGTFQVGASGNRFTVKTSGNVGIGIATPSNKLEVLGTTLLQGNTTIRGGNLGTKDIIVSPWDENNLSHYNISATGRSLSFSPKADAPFGWNWNWLRSFSIEDTGEAKKRIDGTDKIAYSVSLGDGGDLGWGTYTFKVLGDGRTIIGDAEVPAETLEKFKLAVGGKAICEELKVQLSEEWPDYVFARDYYLPSLEETEIFIMKNKHLPGVPSAQEIEENKGFEVGEMSRILLEKIEELTLHVIQINKEKEELKKENKDYKSIIDKLVTDVEQLKK